MEKTILLSPENSAVVSTHTARQDRFIGTERYTWEDPDDWEASFEIKPVSFDFLSEEETNLLEISENKDFTESVSLSVKGQHTDVYNLKTGTRYYWRVNNSEPFSFRVKSGISASGRRHGACLPRRKNKGVIPHP